MAKEKGSGVNRREFLKQSSITVGAVVAGNFAGCTGITMPFGRPKFSGVSIVVDRSDAVAGSKPVQWAAENLHQTLIARGISSRVCDTRDQVDPASLPIIAGKSPKPRSNESFFIETFTGMHGENEPMSVFAWGEDPRGLTYALTELADIVKHDPQPLVALTQIRPTEERPANSVRSAMRMFCSDVEDKGWYNDREFWKRYLTMLVSNRFNRFNLSYGLGYDFATGLLDTYFYFAYPFLLDVPGYNVRATNLSNAERDRNLEMLRFISDETAARGMEFQLGLWTHAYVWQNSPRVNHVIEGLTPDTQPTYSRDAITILLKECPNITGVTFRIHGESGVAEGNYGFWKTIFDGVVRSGRRIPIDMHAKGMDQGMIDTALSTGLPVTISPKFWAEHMGLPYHQASIRPNELPTRQRGANQLMALSTGERSFTRYGYGDLIPENRKYGIIHRVWPGTQRILLWGDPTFAASYGRAASFCGSLGMELMEPLSFKGRKGSGQPGGREGYADQSLRPAGGDFEKFTYTYRLWGRMLYNPDTPAEVWQRQLKSDYGAAAPAVETSLASASRILPLFTTAHCPSAANNNYWPEMYVNMSIVSIGGSGEPYGDTPTPRRFGTVSPLDPQLFYRIEDYADDLLKNSVSGKYSPIEVASWLTDLATTASKDLAEAERRASSHDSVIFRRYAIDTAIQSELGFFFSDKLRAGVLYALYDRTGNRGALDQALASYRSARDHWKRIIDLTNNVYAKDVSVGVGWFQRGHWSDRLPAIEQDIAAMEKVAAAEPKQSEIPPQIIASALAAAQAHPRRANISLQHTPPKSFRPGEAVSIQASAASNSSMVRLFYRKTHQAESWQNVVMSVESGKQTATIPADYSNSPFPLEYYFEITTADRPPTLYPSLGPNLANQPYFVIRQG